MPLTHIDEPGEVDAFGVRFTMENRGERVRCHVFRSALNYLEDRAAIGEGEILARFKQNRGIFERLASRMYDSGHRTPWIDGGFEAG